MGLLSWLFGEDKKTPSIVKLSSGGTFPLEVVGESHYQDALERISGGRTYESQEKIVEAVLVHDDGNPYDNQAIRVDIQGQAVGHLSRESARQFRKKMLETGYSRIKASCAAKIVGGWEREEFDKGDFGVKLDLPSDYFQVSDAVVPKDNNEKDIASTEGLTFDVSYPDQEVLSECRIGEYVKFWRKPDDQKKIYVYREGSIGGTGRVGFVPEKHWLDISCYPQAKIIDFTGNRCRIKCGFFQRDEVVSRPQTVTRDGLPPQWKTKSKPRKKYVLGRGFTFKIQIPKVNRPKKDQLLYINKEFSDNYKTSEMSYKFFDEDGNVVALKWNEVELIRRILRAVKNGYEPTITVQSINGNRLIGDDFIEGKAKVTFKRKPKE